MAPQDGKVEELLQCLPGEKIIVWYTDDTVYHERVLLWKVSDSSWYIVTPDHDVYVEDFSSPQQGPAKFHIKGVRFQYYSRLPHGVYRSDQDLSEDELKRFIDEALDDLGYDVVPHDAWKPAFVRVGRNKVSISKMLGRRVVPRRLVSSRGAGKGVLDVPGPELHELTAHLDSSVANDVAAIDVAPPGKVWVSLPAPGEPSGLAEVVVQKGKGVCTGDREGLAVVSGKWVHVRLMSEQTSNELVSQGSDLTLAARLSKELRNEEPLEAVPKTEEEPQSEDARTLYVDYDEEGERYKEWRQVVLECKEHIYKDWPLEGPLTCQHFIKHTLRYGGDPK